MAISALLCLPLSLYVSALLNMYMTYCTWVSLECFKVHPINWPGHQNYIRLFPEISFYRSRQLLFHLLLDLQRSSNHIVLLPEMLRGCMGLLCKNRFGTMPPHGKQETPHLLCLSNCCWFRHQLRSCVHLHLAYTIP